MSTRPCSLASSASGYLVGWVSELGPAWLRLPTSSSLTAEASYLGEDGAGLVSVCWDGAEPMAVYTQSDGTYLRHGEERVERIGPLSYAMHAAGGWIALATRTGILCGRDELRRVSTRIDVRDLRVCPVPGGAIVVGAGESDVGVIHVSPTATNEVTHRLDVEITGLDLAGRGGRLALVVGTPDQILAAELTGRGQMRERLHGVLRGSVNNPRVAWMVSEFILAGSMEQGVRVERFDGGHLMVLDDVFGPYGLAFQQGRVLAARIQTRDHEDLLLLCSRDRRGGVLDAHAIPCHPKGSALRRRTFAARRIFEQLGAALATTGYRERGTGQVKPRELNARVTVGDFVLQLDARLQHDGVELGIDVGPADPAPPPRSFARLARFFRRLTPEARAAREAMVARVAEVVGSSVDVVEAERSAELTSLTLHAREVPTAVELVRWLKALGEL